MAGLIPDGELATLRATAATAFDTPAVIQRESGGTNTSGYVTGETWPTVASVNVGMARPSASVQQLYAARIGTLASWVIRMPYGTDVRQNDRIIVGGQTLTVQADLSLSSYSTCYSVLATEVREA